MNHSLRVAGKLFIIILMISILLTGCALLPNIVASTAQESIRGSSANDTVTISREEYERFQRYAELDELLQIVEAYYYQSPDVDAMIENAERGLLYALEDPYTYYYNPKQFAEMWEENEGEYAGVGIQLMGSYETFLCVITRVFEGSPAFAAGLRKGDILTMVDDLEVTAYTIQEAVNIMRGEIGKTVDVQVRRNEEFLEFTLTRAKIHINWVSSCMLDDFIGYIVLYEFSGDCSDRFIEQLDELLEAGAKCLIMDLRDNPGGWVNDAVRVADIFLPEATLTYMEDRMGYREYVKTTAGTLDIPMVVIVNENSASASEIITGALQDYGRAVVVGTKSFGKGVVQRMMGVGTQGAGVQVTSSEYFTPNGNRVHKVGITPDIEIAMPEDDATVYQLGDMTDVQLKAAYDAAVELLKAED